MENEHVPYNQPTSNPTPKIQAAGIAGAISVVLMYIIQSGFNITIPAEVASSITVIISFMAGYIKQDVKPLQAARIIQGEK